MYFEHVLVNKQGILYSQLIFMDIFAFQIWLTILQLVISL